jgi:hypothetical protein
LIAASATRRAHGGKVPARFAVVQIEHNGALP